MAIDAKTIKALRDKTGMGISDCKKALERTDGDLEQAELELRKTQKEKAVKKADRPTGQGVVAIRVDADATRGMMVEIACEQEPTIGNERFIAFVETALDAGLQGGHATADDLLGAPAAEGTLADALTVLAGTVGENVRLKRAVCLEAPAGGVIGSYAHFNKKAGALCALALEGGDRTNAALRTAANDICMHAVAARPVALDPESLPAELVEREKEVYREEVKDKPENIQEKILEGKLGKFYSEKCLLQQIFVKDPDGKKTIADVVAEAGKAAGGTARLVAFVRYELGLE